MALLGFSPSMQIIDPKTGQLTRDGANLVQFFVQSVNGAGAVLTNDGEQTLTNKTISGNLNHLSDIDTDSLETRTGSDEAVVTGTAGNGGTLAVWSATGDLVAGPEVLTVLTTSDAEDQYLPRDGSHEATGPVRLATYTVATVPAAAVYSQGLIYVSNETGGATLAFSDGTDWRRVQDRAVIS